MSGSHFVTPSGSVANYTAGARPSHVDPGVTVSSSDTDLSGATVTISPGTLQSGDELNFTSLTGSGISGSYSGGVLTLSGSATPAQYQAALQSVTFSSTSTSTADSIDFGRRHRQQHRQQYCFGDGERQRAGHDHRGLCLGFGLDNLDLAESTERFDTYLVSHGLGDATIPTVGYALQTGANQLTPLPWANLNTISVTFSGAVNNIGLGSLGLVGGTGSGSVAAPR